MIETMAELPHLLAAAIVIVIEWILPIPFRYSPLKLCALLADAIAKKVNKPGSDRQRQISGFMSLLTYFVFVTVIIWALLFIMPYDVWTEAILLYISLSYHSVTKVNKSIKDALHNKQNTLAKDYLAEHAEFDTKPLSTLGIVKGALELEIRSWATAWLTPIILFLTFGGVAAIAYRVLDIAVQRWCAFDPKFDSFGLPSLAIRSTLDWLIAVIVAPIYSVFKSSPGWWRMFRKYQPDWPKQQSLVELVWSCIVAAGCRIEMAGPAMFNGVKVKRLRINEGQKPSQTTIAELQSWNTRFIIFVLVLILLFWLIANTI